MYKEKELREYLKSKTKEEIVDLYIQEIFETDFIIEDLQKDIEHLTDATNHYYNENNKFKRQLAEKDLRIEELESQFDYECECNKQFIDCQNENTQLKQQLAEKDKLIGVYAVEHGMLQRKIADLVIKEMKAEDKFKRQLEEKDKRIRNLNLEAQRYYEDAYCNNFQEKAKIDFAIEQLEKVKYNILCNEKFYFQNLNKYVDKIIDDQIKELKGE